MCNVTFHPNEMENMSTTFAVKHSEKWPKKGTKIQAI